VWLDHSEAHIIKFGLSGAERTVLKSTHHDHAGRAEIDKDYFERIAQSILTTPEILIAGPASAKTEFAKYLGSHHPRIKDSIKGVEPLDHPSDGQILQFAKTYFKGEIAHFRF
jgi:stalled ribosome rescue protein Dom34